MSVAKDVIFVILLLFSTCALSSEKSLSSQILEQDRLLFDAFNAKNITLMEMIFDRDLEFYHDKSGVTDYAKTIINTRNLFASGGDLRRELLTDTVEIYPLNNFGAIQTGQHEFCHTEKGKPDCGVFKFLHIWKNTENGWKLVRVVSYAH
tara:strand:- start:177 stop:626 length:450 start_codon:yes stop_codon:yes gene_type:complete